MNIIYIYIYIYIEIHLHIPTSRFPPKNIFKPIGCDFTHVLFLIAFGGLSTGSNDSFRSVIVGIQRDCIVLVQKSRPVVDTLRHYNIGPIVHPSRRVRPVVILSPSVRSSSVRPVVRPIVVVRSLSVRPSTSVLLSASVLCPVLTSV